MPLTTSKTPTTSALDWRSKADLAAEAAHDRKAEDVVILEVGAIASFADAFVLASGRSDRQVQAIADAVAQAAKEAGEPPIGIEGYREGRWVLIDLADVVVHIFQAEVRDHYDLERLWSDAIRAGAGEANAADA